MPSGQLWTLCSFGCTGSKSIFPEALPFVGTGKLPPLGGSIDIYDTDIRPAGFRVVEMQGAVTDQVVEQTRALVHDRALVREMTDHNFEVGARHFSYEALDRLLDRLLATAAQRRPAL